MHKVGDVLSHRAKLESAVAYVYGLRDSRDKTIRYVGTSVHPNSRLASHAREAKEARNAKQKWIKSVLQSGASLELVILDSCPFEESHKAERLWIQKFDGQLFNRLTPSERKRRVPRKATPRKLETFFVCVPATRPARAS